MRSRFSVETSLHSHAVGHWHKMLDRHARSSLMIMFNAIHLLNTLTSLRDDGYQMLVAVRHLIPDRIDDVLLRFLRLAIGTGSFALNDKAAKSTATAGVFCTNRSRNDDPGTLEDAACPLALAPTHTRAYSRREVQHLDHPILTAGIRNHKQLLSATGCPSVAESGQRR